MKHRWLNDKIPIKCVFILGLIFLFFTGCGGGGSGGSDDVVEPEPNSIPMAIAFADSYEIMVNNTIRLDGSQSYDLDDSLLQFEWSVTSCPTGSTAAISPDDAMTPTITPDIPGDYTISLVVSDNTVSSAPDTITVTAKPYGRINDQNDAEEVLHAIYSGIGYGTNENASLYDVMFNDLNLLWMNLMMDVINDTGVVEMWRKLTFNLPYELPTVFTCDTNASTILTITPLWYEDTYNDEIPFTGVLSSDIHRTAGYVSGDCIYFGQNIYEDEVQVELSGYYKVTGIALSPVLNIIIKNVNILTKEGLKAEYTSDGYYVMYDDIQIQYALKYGPDDDPDPDYDDDPPLNLNLLTSDILDFLADDISLSGILNEDNREYTITGNFTINTSSQSFPYGTTNGLHYAQTQTGNNTFLKVDGSLRTPELDNDVIFASPEIEEINPIVRDSNGIWESGALSFTGGNTTVRVTFNDDGSADFEASEGFSPDSWSVTDWQDTLAPVY